MPGGTRPRRPALAVTGALTAAAAALGALGTTPDSAWYRRLDRPAWEPPGPAFPLVWTPLYGSIAWATARALDAAPEEERTRLLGLLAADLAVNAGWCWTFFRGESPRAGLAVIGVLDALNLALVAETARHDRRAGLTLAPYAAWSLFATGLNAAIARRNR